MATTELQQEAKRRRAELTKGPPPTCYYTHRNFWKRNRKKARELAAELGVSQEQVVNEALWMGLKALQEARGEER